LRADARRNYDAIVGVARQAFAENGTQTSLDDIACRAGVGPGTLYRHFPSRDCLLAAALQDSREELTNASAQLVEDPDPDRALDEWLFRLATHLRTYGGLPDSVAQALQDGTSELARSCDPLRTETDTLLKRAQEHGTARADLSSADVFAIVASLAWASDRRNDSDADLRRLLAITTAGLRGGAAS
jgi:AcrR family transcriptional regulator